MPRLKENTRPSGPTFTLLERRDAFCAVALLALVRCSLAGTVSITGTQPGQSGDPISSSTLDGGGSPPPQGTATATEGGPAEAAPPPVCLEIPDLTSGPYPDVNNMITDAIFNRSDITESRPGTPLALTLHIVDSADGCTPIFGARVMVWQSDANGVFSEYDRPDNSDPAQDDIGSTSTTFLRGWLQTDTTGTITFKTIYPGWYAGRATNISIMVYEASALTDPVKTTELAFPDEVNQAVYAQKALYPKGQNPVTDANDPIFGDGGDQLILATVTPDAMNGGYSATLQVGIQHF